MPEPMITLPGVPIPIWQKKSELMGFMDWISRRDLPLRSLLDIGTFYGGTLWCWMKLAKFGATVMTIDAPYEGDNLVTMGGADLSRLEEYRLLWPSWAVALGCKLVPFIGRSQASVTIEAVRTIFPDGLDFVFIDGSHIYEDAKADFEAYWPMVKKGGVLAMHDINFMPGSGKVWDEVSELGSVHKIFQEDPLAVWFGIGAMVKGE